MPIPSVQEEDQHYKHTQRCTPSSRQHTYGARLDTQTHKCSGKDLVLQPLGTADEDHAAKESKP